MNHLEGLISALMDAELSEEQAKQVQKHLETCPSCQARQKEFEQVDKRFESLAKAELPTGFYERLNLKLQSPRPQENSWAYRPFTWGVTAMSLSVLFIFVVTRNIQNIEILNENLQTNLPVKNFLDQPSSVDPGQKYQPIKTLPRQKNIPRRRPEVATNETLPVQTQESADIKEALEALPQTEDLKAKAIAFVKNVLNEKDKLSKIEERGSVSETINPIAFFKKIVDQTEVKLPEISKALDLSNPDPTNALIPENDNGSNSHPSINEIAMEQPKNPSTETKPQVQWKSYYVTDELFHVTHGDYRFEVDLKEKSIRGLNSKSISFLK